MGVDLRNVKGWARTCLCSIGGKMNITLAIISYLINCLFNYFVRNFHWKGGWYRSQTPHEHIIHHRLSICQDTLDSYSNHNLNSILIFKGTVGMKLFGFCVYKNDFYLGMITNKEHQKMYFSFYFICYISYSSNKSLIFCDCTFLAM